MDICRAWARASASSSSMSSAPATSIAEDTAALTAGAAAANWLARLALLEVPGVASAEFLARLAASSCSKALSASWRLMRSWRCSSSVHRSYISNVSGKVTALRILHFTPVWSLDSGVAFQKKRMNWKHRYRGRLATRCFLFHKALRFSTEENFSILPSRPSFSPSNMWSIFTEAPEPPWILHTSLFTDSLLTTAGSWSVSWQVRRSSSSTPNKVLKGIGVRSTSR
mmetsp:Transcript_20110/g.34895  ORF Transcript_20110/g.34895 Transcript_20110/m.34895 type:complete len:226 (+) Transcript_20110:500-1177(+)